MIAVIAIGMIMFIMACGAGSAIPKVPTMTPDQMINACLKDPTCHSNVVKPVK
jgi:hypothetical protein